MAIHVEIGQLVLHGLPSVSSEQVADALRRELVTRVADGGAAGRPAGEVTHIDGGSIPLHDASAASLTSGIASAVSRAVLP